MSDTFRIHYTPVTEENKAKILAIKLKAKELLDLIEATPFCRERLQGVTELEAAIMWVVKGLTSDAQNKTEA